MDLQAHQACETEQTDVSAINPIAGFTARRTNMIGSDAHSAMPESGSALSQGDDTTQCLDGAELRVGRPVDRTKKRLCCRTTQKPKVHLMLKSCAGPRDDIAALLSEGNA